MKEAKVRFAQGNSGTLTNETSKETLQRNGEDVENHIDMSDQCDSVALIVADRDTIGIMKKSDIKIHNKTQTSHKRSLNKSAARSVGRKKR